MIRTSHTHVVSDKDWATISHYSGERRPWQYSDSVRHISRWRHHHHHHLRVVLSLLSFFMENPSLDSFHWCLSWANLVQVVPRCRLRSSLHLVFGLPRGLNHLRGTQDVALIVHLLSWSLATWPAHRCFDCLMWSMMSVTPVCCRIQVLCLWSRRQSHLNTAISIKYHYVCGTRRRQHAASSGVRVPSCVWGTEYTNTETSWINETTINNPNNSLFTTCQNHRVTLAHTVNHSALYRELWTVTSIRLL